MIYQWVVIDPRKPELFVQARELLKRPKTLGIKIHSPCHGYDILKYADDIFAFAEKEKTFVLMHPDNMLKTAEIAGKYSGMKLIIAHLGSTEYIDAVRASGTENVFVDTSGAASTQNNVIEYTVSQIGSSRIFFGTDTYSCAFQKGRILLSGISSRDKENILYLNAQKHFPQIKLIG